MGWSHSYFEVIISKLHVFTELFQYTKYQGYPMNNIWTKVKFRSQEDASSRGYRFWREQNIDDIDVSLSSFTGK